MKLSSKAFSEEMMPMFFGGDMSAPNSRIRQTEGGWAIYLTEDIDSPDQYIEELHLLRTTSEDEEVEIVLNSGGGSLDTALQFVNAIKSCSSRVTAHVYGANCSASTMIMLACDDYIVEPLTYTMLHVPSGGFVGRFSDSHKQSKFFEDFTYQLYQDTYEGFLSDEEIGDLIEGKDFWFNSVQTEERLQTRRDAVMEKARESTLEYLNTYAIDLARQLDMVEEEKVRLQEQLS